jgi:hypothetical protein
MYGGVLNNWALMLEGKMKRIRGIGVSKVGNDTWEEKGDGVKSTVCAEIDHDHDVKFGIAKGFPDVFGFESNFLIGGIFCKTNDTDFPFSS